MYLREAAAYAGTGKVPGRPKCGGEEGEDISCRGRGASRMRKGQNRKHEPGCLSREIRILSEPQKLDSYFVLNLLPIRRRALDESTLLASTFPEPLGVTHRRADKMWTNRKNRKKMEMTSRILQA